MSSSQAYVPERGDLIWLNFNPQSGREQAGHRPALVLSPKEYNLKTGLAICCPITSQVKGYPFEVALPNGLGVEGAVLSDHLKNLDWRARAARYKGRLPPRFLREVVDRISVLILES